ncbi:MAG: 3-isopropylmalate dehydratase small subunit [Deltaproteobacteria bacterium]|nr:3-isopropylmalate dehydratase small subunit [Deltaproteobacteria bacterium]
MKLTGKAWKFGDDVNTDVIIPAPYLVTSDPKELGSHCMEGADPEFSKKISRGDIVVGGKNFGCGSSREHAPVALTGAGVACVIARSFARIFYRNSFNKGLPLFECAPAVDDIQTGHRLEINVENGEIRNLDTGRTFNANPIPPFMQEILSDGGLMNYVLKGRR